MTIKTKQRFKVIGWYAVRIAIILLAIACIAFPIFLYYSNVRAADCGSSASVLNCSQSAVQPAAVTVPQGFSTDPVNVPVSVYKLTSPLTGLSSWQVTTDRRLFQFPFSLYFRQSGDPYVNNSAITFVKQYSQNSLNSFVDSGGFTSIRLYGDFGFNSSTYGVDTFSFTLYSLAVKINSDGSQSFSFIPLKNNLFDGDYNLFALLSDTSYNGSTYYRFCIPFTYSTLNRFSPVKFGSFSYRQIGAREYSAEHFPFLPSSITNNFALSQLSFSDGNDSVGSFTLSFALLTDFLFPSYTYYTSFSFGNQYENGYNSGYSDGVIAGRDEGYTNGYNQGYDIGYASGNNIGYDNGYKVGQTDGYNNGYNVGNTDGYNTGFSAGVASANDYTFLGLIGAVFDAPIRAITGLLSFDVLGFNMRNFVLSLFTLCIVLKLVSVFTGNVGS